MQRNVKSADALIFPCVKSAQHELMPQTFKHLQDHHWTPLSKGKLGRAIRILEAHDEHLVDAKMVDS